METLELSEDNNIQMFKRPLNIHSSGIRLAPFLLFLICFVFGSSHTSVASAQAEPPHFHYLISFPHPESHCINLELQISNWEPDTIRLKLPNWMPGYYQMMDYAKDLEHILGRDQNGDTLPVDRINENTWTISGVSNRSFVVSYTIRTKRQFVATSYVDQEHAYLVPGNTFLYAEDHLQAPVSVRVNKHPEWNGITTGLEGVGGNSGQFMASDFDRLYDCPILIGDLEELPSFKIKGIEHRFIGYRLGSFNRLLFMENLEKAVRAAVEIIGEIPYEQYTFIAIGPGFGGIEHLNNTTVSFDGRRLNSPEGMDRMMSFLTHEYFHHFNVKRIRPFELGPFDYEQGNRTNLLWVAEGFTVYYEALILKRAGLIDAETFLSRFNAELNTLENDPGRFHQSAAQASYNTWEDGPFGDSGTGPDKSISVYNKGAILAMLLDLEIRFHTKNSKSLDDVLRELYWKYYKGKKRGFTDAEFQQVCEEVAGSSLTDFFEYVYTTKELEYEKYLNQAGLAMDRQKDGTNENAQIIRIKPQVNPGPLQAAIFSSWSGELSIKSNTEK